MAYIGREPQIGNFQVCDAISVVNGQAAYTMQVSSVNVSPETANHMLVSLNGVLQAPGSSYTVSGSTITFASNLVTGDVINFIHILGSVLDLGVPSDSTVSLAKLTATGTKDATTFLRGDNSFAVPSGGKIGQVIQTFKNDTASISATTFADISGMTAAITPSASSSKVLVFVNVVLGTNTGATTTSVRLLRGSTVIGAGASAGGSRTLGIIQSVNTNNYTSLNSSTSFLDSPSATSETTYKLQWRVNDSQTSYLNRGYSDGTDAGKTRTASTITLMEILA